MACKKSGFKSYPPLVGPFGTLGSCIAAVTKFQGAHACYLSDVCGHSTTAYFIDTFYQGVYGYLVYMRHQVDVQSIETKLNTT